MSAPIRGTEPRDRLTRLCAAMTDALHAHPEYSDDVKGVVFLEDSRLGGLQMDNYGHDSEAIAAVLLHLKQIFRSNGQDLHIGSMPVKGQG